jgi:hypothetical protein
MPPTNARCFACGERQQIAIHARVEGGEPLCICRACAAMPERAFAFVRAFRAQRPMAAARPPRPVLPACAG